MLSQAHHLHITVVGSTLYFSANNGTDGNELWKYGGINPPSIAADITPDATGSGSSTCTAPLKL